MPNLEQETLDRVSAVGELLIRAAAVLGTLDEAGMKALREHASGDLVKLIADALEVSARLSSSVGESLRAHAPAGFPLNAKE